MTFRLTDAQFQAFDANGNPLASGSVEFFEAGTSTPKDVYSDSTKTTNLGGTVSLDASGRAAIALDGSYKAIVKDSSGVTVYTADNLTTPPTTAEVTAAVAAAQVIPIYTDVSNAATQTIGSTIKRVYVAGYATQFDGGGAYYKRVDAQPTHGLRFRSQDRLISDGTTDTTNGGWWELDASVLDARAAGFKADGLTASAAGNATALAACEDYLAAKGGGDLWLPSGTAHANAAWALGTTESARIKCYGTVLDFAQATSTVGLSIGAASDIEIAGDLTIQNADSHGLHVTAAASVLKLSGVRVKDSGADGARFDGGSRVTLERFKASGNTGDGIDFAGTTQHDTLTLLDVSSESNGADGISVQNARGLTMLAPHAQSNTSDGIYLANISAMEILAPVVQSNTGAGIKVEATDALNTSHDVDNIKGRITGAYASGNDANAMLLDITTSGSATAEIVLEGAEDTGATASVAVTGPGGPLTGSDNSLSGTGPTGVTLKDGLTDNGNTATASGTAIDVTGIPDDAVLVFVAYENVSTDGTSALILQLGDSGGPETTGYEGYTNVPTLASLQWSANNGAVLQTGVAAADSLHGGVTLQRVDASSNKWSIRTVGAEEAAAGGPYGAGTKSLTGALSQLRLTTVSADDFDAESMSVAWVR